MARKIYTPEQIISKLREAELLLDEGRKVPAIMPLALHIGKGKDRQTLTYGMVHIEYLFRKVRQRTFEKEFEEEFGKENDCRVSTGTFIEAIPEISPALAGEIISEFDQDREKYVRY